MDTDVMLSTIDNPWDPFTQFDEWYAYDEASGYHTTALLARVSVNSENLSELDQELADLEAIDEIVRENVSGVHVKVYRKNKIK